MSNKSNSQGYITFRNDRKTWCVRYNEYDITTDKTIVKSISPHIAWKASGNGTLYISISERPYLTSPKTSIPHVLKSSIDGNIRLKNFILIAPAKIPKSI